MSRYSVEITAPAQKQSKKLDVSARKRVVRVISELAGEPRPVGCKMRKGRDGRRVRVGGHRVVCTVDDGRITVVVFKVGPRGDVYDR